MNVVSLLMDRQNLFGSMGLPYPDLSVNTGYDRAMERYKTDYYCGSQVNIFLGDIWLDEITMIQFQAQQNKRPFYGYKSKKFDLVAAGTQIVQGSFSINYTHANYMNLAVARWKEITQNQNKGRVDPTELEAFLKDITSNPTRLKSLMHSPDEVAGAQAGTFASLSPEAKQKLMEEYFWGVEGTNVPIQIVLAPDDLPTFDITLTFGNYPNDRRNPNNTDEFISSHSTRVIKDVHILSYGLQCTMTAEPIQEIYTFLAKGIDMPLTRVPLELSENAEF